MVAASPGLAEGRILQKEKEKREKGGGKKGKKSQGRRKISQDSCPQNRTRDARDGGDRGKSPQDFLGEEKSRKGPNEGYGLQKTRIGGAAPVGSSYRRTVLSIKKTTEKKERKGRSSLSILWGKARQKKIAGQRSSGEFPGKSLNQTH